MIPNYFHILFKLLHLLETVILIVFVNNVRDYNAVNYINGFT